MARDKKHWMQEAFSGSHGQLRKSTHTKKGRNISKRALNRAAHSKNPRTKKRGVLARTARKIAERRSHRG
jgi:hypothetical protein